MPKNGKHHWYRNSLVYPIEEELRCITSGAGTLQNSMA